MKKRVDYYYLGEFIGKYPADVCTKCGEEVFDESVSDEITERVKEKGLWGLGVRTKIGVSGNSLDLKINKRIADFLKIQKGQDVFIAPIDKRHIQIEIV